MAYSEEDKTKIIDLVCNYIEEGLSLRKALNQLLIDEGLKIHRKVFYEWLDKDDFKSNQYVKAIELRTEVKFDSIEDDYSENPKLTEDGKIDTGWVALQRLKIDAKKWELSKLFPKKYSDKQILSNDEDSPINTAPIINIIKPD